MDNAVKESEAEDPMIHISHEVWIIFDNFFKPTDTIMVATSPRIGVGLGSDSQGSVTLFHKYCFPNLY